MKPDIPIGAHKLTSDPIKAEYGPCATSCKCGKYENYYMHTNNNSNLMSFHTAHLTCFYALIAVLDNHQLVRFSFSSTSGLIVF